VKSYFTYIARRNVATRVCIWDLGSPGSKIVTLVSAGKVGHFNRSEDHNEEGNNDHVYADLHSNDSIRDVTGVHGDGDFDQQDRPAAPVVNAETYEVLFSSEHCGLGP